MVRKEAPWKFVEKYYSEDLLEKDTPETKFYLPWLKNIKGEKVLSIGCGPNLYDDILLFGNTPEEVAGIDLNKNNIEFLKNSKHSEVVKAKKCLAKKEVKIKLISGNALKLKREFIGKFNSIYAIGVLGMFKEKDLTLLLKIISSYLKPNGVLLDIDWTDCKLSKEKYKERLSYGWYSKEGPSIKRIGELMVKLGLKIEKHKVYNVQDPEEYKWGKIYTYLAKK